MRGVGLLAPPVARWGHDWVLNRAASDFPGPVLAVEGEGVS